MAQANCYEPDTVILQDIMSKVEIQSAFNELKDINQQFLKKTNIISKGDLAFLVIATALQVTKALIYPYIVEKFDYIETVDKITRLNHNDKSIENIHRKANNNFRDKKLGKHESGHWLNILCQTPPYDITKGSKELGINIGGKYIRMYTLGHDPILGWVFGTMNILTDVITMSIQSLDYLYHCFQV